ncbi:phosphatidic acid phosphatase type 2/haloperoxidase [Cantharellus anzutake]|uniref:phosphatidic acid phosphatase type 2/haloperoxidase n=1 Tax=Cantharellus anzutake TaxID=1750568 RepID=UPI001906E169|nr:phosphatidic acid phosphatase type 2/haloperoxidase [Cantharellus anzutake]KAF8327778.1 phosphatidic acid phosphatase type 2/haloperoxidase [Cantharellus anzutake]
MTPGTQFDAKAYEAGMLRWTVAIRRFLLRRVKHESVLISDWQRRVTSPFLDVYFHYSALLGTTTFFVATIPLLFFFGYPESGRGLLFVLCMGGYLSSVVKDFFAVPRPYSPPVIRIEYGFPSTHTANCVSATLYLFALISQQELGALQNFASSFLLLVYCFSVMGGRVYCGMHTVTDCLAGFALGAVTHLVHVRYGGWLEATLVHGGSEVPATLISVWVFALSYHPSTIDLCLCFDDAIACLSALIGALVGRWTSVQVGVSSYRLHPTSVHALTPRTVVRLMTFSILKVILGVGCLLVWRLIMKIILPPIILWIFPRPDVGDSKDFLSGGGGGGGGSGQDSKPFVDPVPSVVDIPSLHPSGSLLSSPDTLKASRSQSLVHPQKIAPFKPHEGVCVPLCLEH